MSGAGLAAHAAELVAAHFRQLIIPTYFRTALSYEEQVFQRGKPLPYLQLAKVLMREFGFTTVVEIGSMREPMLHGLADFNPVCCNDGHSTVHFAATGAAVFSADINPRCAEILAPVQQRFPRLAVFTRDGIDFLESFDRRIDVLFLDAWDVVEGTDYAEKHLEAYRVALPKLAARCLVQIDDTDLLNGGKGRLAIPQMIRDGFDLVTWGRQAILVRDL